VRAAAIALLAAACGGEADDFVVRPGIVEFYDMIEIEVPSAVPVGTAFTVRITTFGGGCESFEDTTVGLVPHGAIVTPRDRSHIVEACTTPLLRFAHEASLTFSDPGSKTVVIHGRRVGSEAGIRVDEEIEIAYVLAAN